MPRVKSVHIQNLPPLHDLTISEIPSAAALVVLMGPNGSGKTSVLDALRQRASESGPAPPSTIRSVQVDRHGEGLGGPFGVYLRTAYRAQHDFNASGAQLAASLRLRPAMMESTITLPNRASSPDPRAEGNYLDLIRHAEHMCRTGPSTWSAAIDSIINPVQTRLSRLLPRLRIESIKDEVLYERPIHDPAATFYFTRGTHRFTFAALSAGERELFDLLLDLELFSHKNQDALYCIDEPELHIHTSLQSGLVRELMDFLPPGSQMWIATHSIGILRAAMALQRKSPSEVAFLDLEFRQSGTVVPAKIDKGFWRRTLQATVHDLADLVAPEHIVICEGKPKGGSQRISAFDAQVYNRVFSDTHPETTFVSGGCSNDVIGDAIKLKAAVQIITPGVTIETLVDRDNRSQPEIDRMRAGGGKVLSRYSIENYLWSDELLGLMMNARGCSVGERDRVIAAKATLLNRPANAGESETENVKAVVGPLYVECMKLYPMKGSGSNSTDFALTALVPFLTPDTKTYTQLYSDIFL